jgi:hypothetical protein
VVVAVVLSAEVGVVAVVDEMNPTGQLHLAVTTAAQDNLLVVPEMLLLVLVILTGIAKAPTGGCPASVLAEAQLVALVLEHQAVEV